MSSNNIGPDGSTKALNSLLMNGVLFGIVVAVCSGFEFDDECMGDASLLFVRKSSAEIRAL